MRESNHVNCSRLLIESGADADLPMSSMVATMVCVATLEGSID